MARQHAQLCRAKLTGRNADCECDASDATRSKLMTPGEMANRIDELGAAPEPPPRNTRMRSVAPPSPGITDVTATLEAEATGTVDYLPPQRECPRCSECVGQNHHWIENPDFEDEDSPEFACKHCDALCYQIEDDDLTDGLMVPSGDVIPDADGEGRQLGGLLRRNQYLSEAAQQALIQTWRQVVGDNYPAEPAVDPETADTEYLDRIGSLISDRSYSLVSLRRERDYAIDVMKDRPIQVRQVCPACREAYMVKTGDRPTVIEAYTIIGQVARRARLMHKCPEITGQLSVLSFDDLQTLHEELERRGEQTLARSVEVLEFAKQRRAREVE